MKILWDQSYQYDDIRYEQGNKDAKGIVRIVINRPHLRNAFRPKTIIELKDAFEKAQRDFKGVFSISSGSSYFTEVCLLRRGGPGFVVERIGKLQFPQ